MRILLLLFLVNLQSDSLDADVIIITGGLILDGQRMTSSVEARYYCDYMPSLPNPRATHITTTTADGLILTCGGETTGHQADYSCLVLDTYKPASWPILDWIHHSSLDKPRRLSSVVSLPKGLLLLGGDGSGGSSTSSFLPTGTNSWEAGPELPRGGAEESCAVMISDHQFLIIGGSNDPHQVYEYNMQTEAWTKWPNLKEEKSGHACIKTGQDILIVGGSYEKTFKNTTTILNISSKTQRSGGTLNIARGYFGLARFGRHIHAIGGMAVPENAYDGPILYSMEWWDEDTERWTLIEFGGNPGLRIGRAAFGYATVSRCPDAYAAANVTSTGTTMLLLLLMCEFLC